MKNWFQAVSSLEPTAYRALLGHVYVCITVSELRGIRDAAVHRVGVEISRSEARGYLALSKRVIVELRTQ